MTEEKVLDTNPSLHQIPPPPQDFIGRKDDINEIMASFDQGATITGLRGMGGVGKTALALVLADRLKERFPDGLLFLNMQETIKNPLKPEDAMAHVIRSYRGANATVPKDLNGLSGLYHSVLSGKKVLILLDNAASKEQVELLLPPVGCALLVTSRKKFALPGLLEKDLDVLPLEDAKNLLLDIAQRIGDYAEELAKLCGCLPIALRNAACALKEKPNLSLEGYIKRLGDAKERLELVDASFCTSYELLTPELQRLWSLLSVFPADFNLEGAAAVWEMEVAPTEDALGELMKMSIVDYLPSATGEGGRYKLHDLARDFAGSRLDAIVSEPAKLRHSEHYLKVLSEASLLYRKGGRDTFAGLKLFDCEWANIRSGQKWAEETTRHYHNNKINPPELCSEYKSALRLSNLYPDAGPSILVLRQHPQDRIHWLKVALAASQILKDCRRKALHIGNMGLAYAAIGNNKKSITLNENALKIAQQINDLDIEAKFLGNLAAAYNGLGEIRRQMEENEKALIINRKIGDLKGEANNLDHLGRAYFKQKEIHKAIEFTEQALEINRQIEDRRGEAYNLGNLAEYYKNLDESHQLLALELSCQALDIFRDIKDGKGEAYTLGNQAGIYMNLNKGQMALESNEKAFKIFQEIGNKRGIANILRNMGQIYSDLNQPEKAIVYLEQALNISREVCDKRAEAFILLNMCQSMNKLGKREKAIPLANSSLEIFEQIESPYAEIVRKQLAEWGA